MAIVVFFVILATVDGYIIYAASTSDNGVVTDNAYQDGIHYQQEIDAMARAEALLGKPSLEFSDASGADGSRLVSLSFAGAKTGDHFPEDLTVIASRPADQRLDTTFILRRTTNDPRPKYHGSAPLPAPGLWFLKLEATSPNGPLQWKMRQILP
ncbi:MAG: FixH family protein [Bdellovibrionales bacterium]|nr:FixH family protein [Bdellovibrionales bacterium]